MSPSAPSLNIGWSDFDITPTGPVNIQGQFHIRISEGVLDPLRGVALILEQGEEVVIWVSLDVVMISTELEATIRERLGAHGLPVDRLIVHATHTHEGPQIGMMGFGRDFDAFPLPLPMRPTPEVMEEVATKVVAGVLAAWGNRRPGTMAFGLGQAVIGRNRRSVDADGVSQMYRDLSTGAFSHIEGYEDHDLNLVATYDLSGKLTGLVVNVACPAQVHEQSFELSADYWCEVRARLRREYGEDLQILPQISAAGDLAPQRFGRAKYVYNHQAEARMLQLRQRTEREEYAERIATAVASVLPAIAPTRSAEGPLRFRAEALTVPLNRLTAEDDARALAEQEKHEALLAEEIADLKAHPERMKEDPRWYVKATRLYRIVLREKGVRQRFAQWQAGTRTTTTPIRIIRWGEMAWATNAYEYYLDFGIQIKAASPAVQTFLVQLAGPGTYCPSWRSVAGGGYGSIPASNVVGPEAGERIRDRTLEILREFF